jgi:hypothetical protein
MCRKHLAKRLCMNVTRGFEEEEEEEEEEEKL